MLMQHYYTFPYEDDEIVSEVINCYYLHHDYIIVTAHVIIATVETYMYM